LQFRQPVSDKIVHSIQSAISGGGEFSINTRQNYISSSGSGERHTPLAGGGQKGDIT
jgi:hypothetical protein